MPGSPTAMSPVAVDSLSPRHPDRPYEERLMTATYTFDVFCSLDGYGSFNGGDWGGYWGKQGPEFLDHRLAVISEEQRMVLGANTFRDFLSLLGPITESSEVDDPINHRMRNLPTTVV